MTQCSECGLRYVGGIPDEDAAHRSFHREHVNGPKTSIRDGTHLISPASSLVLRKLAEKTARIARRDTTYDFPLYSAGEHDPKFKTLIALEVRDGHAIGILVTREKPCAWRAPLDSFEEIYPGSWKPTKGDEVSEHTRRAIDFIWVLKKWRGQGVMDGLLKAASEHLSLPIDQFAHGLPFTKAALTFWRKRLRGAIYVV